MRLWTCRGCAAKDEEIARLWSLVAAKGEPPETPWTCGACARVNILERSGDVCPACGNARGAVVPSAPDPDPLPKVIDEALGKKYEVNSRDWRSERRAARQLVNEGMDPEAVAILVAKGQPTERW